MAKTNHHISKTIPDETVIRKIFVIRGEKIMLDNDLANLYEVETGYLKRQVRRNIKRFPPDFMFELTAEEYLSLRSQSGTLKRGSHAKYLPFAFTEQGVAMLSGIISSSKAIDMNIAIMRAFVEIRKIAHSDKKLAEQVKILFDRIGEHDTQLSAIYDAIENLLDDKTEKKTWNDRERIGFKK